MTESKQGILVFYNGAEKTLSFYADENYKDLDKTHKMRITRTGTNGVTFVFASGLSMTISLNLKMLDLNVKIPDPLSSTSKYQGLLGNFNGDPNDDLQQPNGTVLPKSATESEIYYNFGELWRTSTTLFTYPAGKSITDFQFPGFVPIFIDSFSKEKKDAAAVFCRNVTEKEIVIAENKIPVVDGTALLKATVGQPVVITASATDADNDNITLSVFGSFEESGIGTGSVNLTHRWTPQDIQPVNISIFAEDNKQGTSAVLTVLVRLCRGCSNNGVCQFDAADGIEDSYYLVPCTCTEGWTGDNCEEDVNGCADDPCPVGTTCTDIAAAEYRQSNLSFKCGDCPTGYDMSPSGDKCIDVNECLLGSHGCAQTCQNAQGSYTCSCEDGYRLSGGDCDDIDECSEGTSGCEQICTNNIGSYTCGCQAGFELAKDNLTCSATSDICAQLLDCEYGCMGNSSAGFHCFCAQGYNLDENGTGCQDIDECKLVGKCPQLCRNSVGSFSCDCYDGYKLKSDKKSCEACDGNHWGPNCNNLCDCGQNQLRCDSSQGCVCKEGWSGKNCKINIDECAASVPLCGPLETCVDAPGSYSCICKEGYTRGSNNQCQNVDECSTIGLNNCAQDCVDTQGNYSCHCKTGYQGDGITCTDIDECSSNLNNCQQTCVNQVGDFNCECFIGFILEENRHECKKSYDPCAGSGKNCSKAHGCTLENGNPACICNSGYLLTDSGTCEDINECSTRNGNCSVTCTNTDGSHFCSCNSGDFLANDGLSCHACTSLDKWGANCSETCDCGIGSEHCDKLTGCKCWPGWVGTNCDEDVNECDTPATCTNNQICVNSLGSFTCACEVGFQMVDNTCVDINECEIRLHDCQQRCINTEGSFVCSCQSGFELVGRTDCQNINECSKGSHDCEQVCTDTGGSFLCSCHPGFILNTDQKTCIKDSTVDPCQAVDSYVNCEYGCELKQNKPVCYCAANSNLNPADNQTCIGKQNSLKISVKLEMDYKDELADKTSKTFKEKKSDLEAALRYLYRHLKDFSDVIINGFRSGSLFVDHTIIFATENIDTTYATEVARVMKNASETTQLVVNGEVVNIVGEPTIDNTHITCQLCDTVLEDCLLVSQNAQYECRSKPYQLNSIYVKIEILHVYEEDFADLLSLANFDLRSKVESALRNLYIDIPELAGVLVTGFGNGSHGSTVIENANVFNATVGSEQFELFAERLETVNKRGCIDLDGACVMIPSEPLMGDGIDYKPVICYTCGANEVCAEIEGHFACRIFVTTTVARPPDSNLDSILGLGIGIPLGIIFMLVVLVLGIALYRNRRGESIISSDIDRDPYNIRDAFGTMSSAYTGRHSEEDKQRIFRGRFLKNWQDPRVPSDSLGGAEPLHGDSVRDPYRQQERMGLYPSLATHDDESSTETPQMKERVSGRPVSSFSWDFLFKVLEPNEDFRIQRPFVEPEAAAPFQPDMNVSTSKKDSIA
ncbi:hypothetical protein ScPMuIL_011791 [Solemya velum]